MTLQSEGLALIKLSVLCTDNLKQCPVRVVPEECPLGIAPDIEGIDRGSTYDFGWQAVPVVHCPYGDH